MIEINNSKINIDDIKARIKEEAARHRRIDDFIEDPGYNDGFSSVQGRPFDAGRYHYSDFLQFHGRDFINKAYGTILHREPDPEGYAFYFEKLIHADLTKVDILGRLRYSGEGRRKKVPVKGLLFPFLVQTGFKIPFLGWALRVVATVLNLPMILKNFQKMDGTVAEQNQAIIKAKAEIETLKKTVLYNRMTWETEAAEKERQITALKSDVRGIENELNQKAVSNETVHDFDTLYKGLEERFRGQEADIKALAEVYLPHVKTAMDRTGGGSLLDVGCGRGEWLGLLKEHHIPASGVDQNKIQVDKCRKAGLDVTASDAVSCLQSLQDESLSVITGFHFVEHLPLNILITLIDEAFRVLKPGGMVIFETPNPENLMVGAFTFYLDPTHKNPIPPDTLSYLVEARGFERTQILRLHPNPWMTFDNPLLNQLLAVGQDYSVMGFKA